MLSDFDHFLVVLMQVHLADIFGQAADVGRGLRVLEVRVEAG